MKETVRTVATPATPALTPTNATEIKLPAGISGATPIATLSNAAAEVKAVPMETDGKSAAPIASDGKLQASVPVASAPAGSTDKPSAPSSLLPDYPVLYYVCELQQRAKGSTVLAGVNRLRDMTLLNIPPGQQDSLDALEKLLSKMQADFKSLKARATVHHPSQVSSCIAADH